MDIDNLIWLVRNRRAIWDLKNKQYYNRDLTMKMWTEVAGELGVTVAAAKTKWKHLRDNYRTETNKSLRPAVDADGVVTAKYTPTWIWYESLHFLREIVSSRSSNSTVPEETPVRISPAIDSVESTEVSLENTEYYNDSTNEPDYLYEKKPDMADLPPLYHKGQKRKFMDTPDATSVEEEQFELSRLENCDTYHFLISTRNAINSLPLNRQMYLRIKFQELIYNELEKINSS